MSTAVRHLLQALLRASAQPVAVVTAILPTSNTFHGATLSSFTSIALHPLPLVAFSLRVPSRMASALTRSPSTLVINVLSAAQPDLARRFAKPDQPHLFADVSYTVSREGLPVLAGALGALSCRLVGPSLPLARLRDLYPCEEQEEEEVEGQEKEEGLASELFIARVLRVERVSLPQDDLDLHKLPLVYHRRRYTTVSEDAT